MAVKTQIQRKSGFINFSDLTTTYLLAGGCVLFCFILFLQENVGAVGYKNLSAVSESNRNIQLNSFIFLQR